MKKMAFWLLLAAVAFMAVLIARNANAQEHGARPLMSTSIDLIGWMDGTAHGPSVVGYRKAPGGIPLNNLVATPGATDPKATAKKLCDPNFHTGTVRNVTESEKKAVCREYGITSGCPGKGYEIDHLISLEIGGANDISNLWPQPAPSYHVKDVLENRLHKEVCQGDMSLEQAQTCISVDWVACAKKFPDISQKLESH
jgi:hypothetical protein